MKTRPQDPLSTHQHRFDTGVSRALSHALSDAPSHARSDVVARTFFRTLRGAALAGGAGALLLSMGCSKQADAPAQTGSNAPYSSPTPAANAGATAGEVVDDGVITSKIKTAFLAEKNLNSMDISVETQAGTVTLTGMVDSQAQIDDAMRLARTIDGTKSVQNMMTVKR